jgi:hypothetical protein
MKIEVSVGEAIDKLNILEIKLIQILDETKQHEINKEIHALQECRSIINTYPKYYEWLTFVNTNIWNYTNIIKEMDVTHESFSIISNTIFEENQKRFRIKSFFNLLTDSCMKEQKSYECSHCRIHISSKNSLYDRISEINYLSISYDYISFDTPFDWVINDFFKQPNILQSDTNIKPTFFIELEHFTINEQQKTVFDNEIIKYVAGGLLGDFIHSLSVVNEMFLKTGKKGNVYMTNDKGGDPFRFAVERTYNDIREVVVSQKYINNLFIYNNESYDINLNDWRLSPYLNCDNWYHIYKQTYGVEWGTHTWLSVITNSEWESKYIVNTTSYRFPYHVNFHTLYNSFSDSMIFVSFDKSEYDFFKDKTQLNIPYYNCTSFTELCIMINSCKMFVGGLSMPLTIAHSLHKNRIVCMHDEIGSKIRENMNDIWKNIYII